MKMSVFTIRLFLLWGLTNLIILKGMSEEGTETRLAPELVERFEPLTLRIQTSVSKNPIPFQARLLKPNNLEKRQLYPLIVSLHGAWERGNDNQRQLKYLPQQMAQSYWREKYPCFLLAPQCPLMINWSSTANSLESAEDNEQNLLDQIHEMIQDVSSKYPIDKRRIYITGYSMGGFGTWSMIARYPNTFAAAVPICGGGNTDTVSRFLHLPIWVAHGDADQVVPVTGSRAMVDTFRNMGGVPIYKELQGVNHDSWTQTYEDSNGMMAWLFQQRKTSKGLP